MTLARVLLLESFPQRTVLLTGNKQATAKVLLFSILFCFFLLQNLMTDNKMSRGNFREMGIRATDPSGASTVSSQCEIFLSTLGLLCRQNESVFAQVTHLNSTVSVDKRNYLLFKGSRVME